MASSELKPRGMSRRFALLAVGIVAAVALYTAGWFYAAGRLEAEVARGLDRARAEGAEADCTNPVARGYPFRIGIFCDAVAYRDAEGRVTLEGRGLRSAAQIYQPWRIVGEMDTATLALGGAAGLGFGAGDIRYSTRLNDPLPDRVSVTGRTLVARAAATGEAPFADAVAGEAHLRRNGGDLDVAVNVDDLQWKLPMDGGEILPPLDGVADLTLTDGVRFLAERPTSMRGTSGEIRSVTIGTAEAGIGVSGPFSVDAEGLLDATLTLSIRNPQALSVLLAEAFPQIRPQVDQTASIVAALGDNPQLPLSVSKGVVRMGFFTLGRIPAL